MLRFSGPLPPVRRRRLPWLSLLLGASIGLGTGCAADSGPDGAVPDLGPVDGFDLPPTDLDRVSVGDPAPLFTLESYHGKRVSLADYRGEKNVVLVFYRGHW